MTATDDAVDTGPAIVSALPDGPLPAEMTAEMTDHDAVEQCVPVRGFLHAGRTSVHQLLVNIRERRVFALHLDPDSGWDVVFDSQTDPLPDSVATVDGRAVYAAAHEALDAHADDIEATADHAGMFEQSLQDAEEDE
jgi:hypothetical protein